jgi:hypothetical protein
MVYKAGCSINLASDEFFLVLAKLQENLEGI